MAKTTNDTDKKKKPAAGKPATGKPAANKKVAGKKVASSAASKTSAKPAAKTAAKSGQSPKPASKSETKPVAKKKAEKKTAIPATAAKGNRTTVRLKQYYESEIRDQLQKKFSYGSPMQLPRLEKIVINMGVGDAVQDRKRIEKALEELTAIAGQKPVVTRAKKSIAGFKLREGVAIGCKVTLRKDRMYEFLDRLITIAMPRVRDFRGVNPKSFDGHGNYALGLKEQIVFPEINYDKVDRVRGMDIVICTTANTDDEARALLEAFNMPFWKTGSAA